MRIFPPELEERAFRGEPLRAAWPLRLVLFGLSALCLSAAFVLIAKDLHGRSAVALAAFAVAGAALAAAEGLIRALKLYRQGAEEALVAGAVVLAAFGAERLAPGGNGWRFSEGVFAAALAAAAAAAYARYGYRLALIGLAAGLSVMVVSWDLGANPARVGLAVLYGALLAAVSLWPGLPRRERERLESARFVLALAVPLVLNLALDRAPALFGVRPSLGAFEWATLAAVFLLPAAVLAWGISSRARVLLWAGAAGLLVAVCSVKPYFGRPRHPWDPAVLGAALIAVAVLLKRWLDAGPEGRRGAYSSEPEAGKDPGGALALLAGAVAAGPAAPPSGPSGPTGGGGDFGGGGASGSF